MARRRRRNRIRIKAVELAALPARPPLIVIDAVEWAAAAWRP